VAACCWAGFCFLEAATDAGFLADFVTDLAADLAAAGWAAVAGAASSAGALAAAGAGAEAAGTVACFGAAAGGLNALTALWHPGDSLAALRCRHYSASMPPGFTLEQWDT
jgi:hypothetical protein